jgi:hypothetical protein
MSCSKNAVPIIKSPPAERVLKGDVPREMLVGCPLHKTTVRVVDYCDRGCPFFKAMGVLNPSDRIPWEQRHVVLCQYPRKFPVARLAEL